MSGLLAAAGEPTDWARSLLGLGIAAAGIWVGIRAWHDRMPGSAGRESRYQTYWGAAHSAAVFGAGFGVMSLGELIRGVAGLSTDSAFFWATSLLGVAILAAGFLYVLAYFWVGVPPRLRPPHQRAQGPVGSDRP